MNAVRALSGPPGRLVGAALARIFIGAAGLHFYLSSYRYRWFLWGPSSYRAHTHFDDALSLYRIADSRLWFELLFHAGIAAALAFAVFGGRALAVTHAVLLWSIYQRNPAFLEGGDNFGRIAVVLLIFAVTNGRLSPRRTPSPARWPLVHNTAVVVLVFQIAMVYLNAGLWKVASASWRQGTALWSIAQLEDFAFASWIEAVYRNPVAVGVLTYAVVGLEAAFVPLLFTRFRTAAVAAIAAMHVGIAVTMGLVGFALNMFAGLAICLSDDDYARLRRLVVRAGPRRRHQSPARERAVAAATS